MALEASKPGRSVYVKMGMWWDPEQGHIHLTAPGVHGFHTTVCPNPDSKRGHPNLFAKLARALRDAGAPHPDLEEDAQA